MRMNQSDDHSLQRPDDLKVSEWRKTAALKRRASSRRAILKAAREIFTEADYESVTVDEIARKAKVGPATIYNHFGTKAALIAHLFEEPMRELEKHVLSDIDADLTLDEAVHRHFLRLSGTMSPNRKLVIGLWKAINETGLSTKQSNTAEDPRNIVPLPRPLTTLLQSFTMKHDLKLNLDLAGAAAMVTNAFLIRILRNDDPQAAAKETADLLLYGVCGRATKVVHVP
ncbi:MAG: TetR/AcrR family transcriptional regulator [Bacteroidetes bacterium]|nr:TetR/AcrR family transcriptional regulator [Bacteroidota bacterium]MCL5738284.1 TetR/AcrR family transcriptional regulator [Bacteroidota bacterium]